MYLKFVLPKNKMLRVFVIFSLCLIGSFATYCSERGKLYELRIIYLLLNIVTFTYCTYYDQEAARVTVLGLIPTPAIKTMAVAALAAAAVVLLYPLLPLAI